MFRVSLFFALLGVSLAAVAIAPHAAKPDKFKDIEGCYIPELDRVLPFGERAAAATGCFQHSCSDTYVQLLGCGAISVSDGCKQISDATKPYPDCCPTMSCPSS